MAHHGSDVDGVVTHGPKHRGEVKELEPRLVRPEVLPDDISPGVVTHGPRAQRRRGKASGNHSYDWCGRRCCWRTSRLGCNAWPKGTEER